MHYKQKKKKKKTFNKELLEYIYNFRAINGYSPSIRDIQTAMDWASTNTVRYNLDKHMKHGYLSYIPNRARTVMLTKRGQELILKTG